MKYEVIVTNVGDADAIILNYHDGNRWWTAVIDAGNVGDGVKVKEQIRHRENSKLIIDYAYCSHPDIDHKGGFFDLLSDPSIIINTFYIRRPDTSLMKDYRRLLYPTGSLVAAAHKVYDYPSSSDRNLIEEAERKGILKEPQLGVDVMGMPLKMVGPREDFFKAACYDMALHFSELEDEIDYESYAEDELPSERDAQSVMDEVKEESATNRSSLILLFHPGNKYFLLSGDSCSASIKDAVEDYPYEIPGSTLKVPHHGSKHNLTTEIIDLLRPNSAVISCKGTKKHPSSAVVHFLSKYCNVYSTSKSGTLIYHNFREANPATPLRKKQL